MTKDLRAGFEQRRHQVEGQRSQEGGVITVEGFVELIGLGEATLDVQFPCTFIEQPVIMGGGAVAENQQIIPGTFPRWSVGVLWWLKSTPKDMPDAPVYRGARLVIVVEGAGSAFESHVIWTATGRAITNPAVGGL